MNQPAASSEHVARAVSLAGERPRVVIGIAGVPGAGKSTYARALAAAVIDRGVPAAYLPMDGFHLPAAELARRGLAGRKGAPETFDAAAYVGLLRSVRDVRAAGRDILAPDYDRDLHDVVPGRLVIPAGTRVVVTEGNYLGLSSGGWEGVRPLLDALWWLDVPWEVARARLIERRVATGRSREDAVAWVDSVDEANARIVQAARASAAP